MNKKRVVIRHFIILLMAAAGLLASFYMPYAAYAYEDYKLDDYQISYDARPLYVESEQIALTEKLMSAKEAVSSYSYISVDIAAYEASTGKVNLDDEKALQISKDILVSLFAGQSVYNIKTIEKYKAKLDSIETFYIQPCLIVEREYMSTFLVWSVDLYSDYGGNIQLFIDDETGILLSLYGTKAFFDINHSECARNGNMENVIGDYYGLHYIARSITESLSTSKEVDGISVSLLNYRYILSNENDTERVAIDMLVTDDSEGMMFFNYYDLEGYNQAYGFSENSTVNLSDLYQDGELDGYLYNGDVNNNTTEENIPENNDILTNSDTDAMPD